MKKKNDPKNLRWKWNFQKSFKEIILGEFDF